MTQPPEIRDAEDADAPVIELNQISFSYPGREKTLASLNLSIRRGDRIGLIGPNGSGKTTLFHIIMGLTPPTEGTIRIFGKTMKREKDFRDIYRKVGLLFQDADDQLFSPTVLEDVAFGPLNLGKSRTEAAEIAVKTLDALGLSGFEDRVTHKLSGGEKRLAALAAVLAMEPEVLLLDEPSAGLDEKTRNTLARVLRKLDLTYIIISHEIEFMTQLTDAIYLMENGNIRTDVNLSHYVHTHLHQNPAHRH